MPKDWEFGDDLDFQDTDGICDIEEYYLITCVQCGRKILVCGCYLSSGVEVCPCSGEHETPHIQ